MKKKIFSLALSLIAVFGMSSCETNDESIDIAMVTDVGNIDDGSFNQFTYEGCQAVRLGEQSETGLFQAQRRLHHRQSRFHRAGDQQRRQGHRLPGYLFEASIYEVQDKHPEVAFLLLDGEAPTRRTTIMPMPTRLPATPTTSSTRNTSRASFSATLPSRRAIVTSPSKAA